MVDFRYSSLWLHSRDSFNENFTIAAPAREFVQLHPRLLRTSLSWPRQIDCSELSKLSTYHTLLFPPSNPTDGAGGFITPPSPVYCIYILGYTAVSTTGV